MATGQLPERKQLLEATVDRAYVGEESVTGVMPKTALYTTIQPALE